MKSIVLIMALLKVGYACMPSGFNSVMDYDTLESGSVRSVRITTFSNPINQHPIAYLETLTVSQHSDFRVHVGNAFYDSALIFLGRLDSIWTGDPMALTPDINLFPPDTGIILVSKAVTMRLQIDSLFRGSVPKRTMWIRIHLSLVACTDTLAAFLQKPFFNFSDRFLDMSDLKVDFGAAATFGFPIAHWFDGRYLVSPDFPGLKLDITELYPNYPATPVYRRGNPVVPMRLEGKVYRPDGRVVPETERRLSPVPLLK